MDSLQEQIGGNHYKGLPYQPVEFAVDAKLDFIQGCIVKYVSRYKNKNGIEDLQKAKHFAKLGLKLDSSDKELSISKRSELAAKYVNENNLSDLVGDVVLNTLHKDWIGIVLCIDKLIAEYNEQNH